MGTASTNGAARKVEPQVVTILMDETVQKSCWGVTLWAVIGLFAVIMLTYLFAA